MFSFENIKNKKMKMKFRKYKDWKIVRVGKHKGWKMYGLEENQKSFRNDYNLEIGPGFVDRQSGSQKQVHWHA